MDAVETLVNDADVVTYLSQLTELQTENIQLLNSIYSLLHIAIVAIGVILFFVVVWRCFRVFT